MVMRGTTPSLIIKVNSNLNLSTLSVLWVTIQQETYQKTYTLDDVEIDAAQKKISVYMSQEETLKFSEGYANIQIRGLTSDNKAVASKTKNIEIGRILKEGVIA